MEESVNTIKEIQITVPWGVVADYLQERVDGFFLIQDKLQLNKEPTYTYSEALAKVQNGRNYGLLSVEAAAALLQRAIVPAEGGRYKLSIDQRLKFFINPLSDFRYISEVMRKHPLLCPALIVLGSESTLQQTYMEPVLKSTGGWTTRGAFDRLVPLLPQSFYYLCVDLPGHGRSSHFPPFLPLYTLNNIIAYKAVMQHFKRGSYIILGHSYGGQIGLLFAQLYPQYVEKLIMLDTIHIITVPSSNFKNHIADRIEENMALQEKLAVKTQPTYTYEQAFKKLMSGRQTATTPLVLEAAKALMSRGVERVGDDRYKFTLDQRMKCYIDPLHDNRYALETLKRDPVKCPVLIILAHQSRMFNIYFKDIIGYLKKRKNFTIKYVDGDHDVHNNSPEVVAPHINKFLLTRKALEHPGTRTVIFGSRKFLRWLK
ncbi:hypothetical protein NQ318_009876 [Aromia moschata]|uniref:AB hydrolase-1 domain-containing protein n=1 Tax=Aromia moschata TaxID=1265417 RepID=A0AAV8Y203_9CUCU|nr:hypothetical protein NQ318_009876 [Aromia moschata]